MQTKKQTNKNTYIHKCIIHTHIQPYIHKYKAAPLIALDTPTLLGTILRLMLESLICGWLRLTEGKRSPVV